MALSPTKLLGVASIVGRLLLALILAGVVAVIVASWLLGHVLRRARGLPHRRARRVR